MKYLLILVAVVLISCEKFDNSDQEASMTLPAYSTSGNMTFGFRYNDSIWTNLGKTMNRNTRKWEDNMVKSYTSVTPQGERIIEVSGRLTLVRESTIYRDLSTSLSFRPDTPYVKSYQIDGIKNRFSMVDYLTNRLLTVKHNFTLEVTRLDTVAKICSGIFYGTLYNKNNPADTVRITDGRFDVRIGW